MALSTTQIQAQIDWLETLIPQLRSAIFALSTGTQKNYSISDGQATQSVTKKDLGALQIQLDKALEDLGDYQEQITPANSGGFSWRVQ